jgi:putative ABC transport system permease protein
VLSRLRSLWQALVRRTTFEREMDDELRFHLESRADDLVTAGLTRADAVRRARLEFGNPEAWQDRCRESKRLNLVDDLQLDVRFAIRTLRKQALLTSAIIVTLTLGIGATTALFSIVNGVLLRPLPYPEPDRLMTIGYVGNDGELFTVFGPDYLEWRAQCDVCEEVAAYSGSWASNISGGSAPDRVVVGHVTANMFTTMGVQPMLGRTFLSEETGRPIFGARATSTPITAVILSHALWQRRFGGDPAIVGKTAVVDGDPCTIVGVMPGGFNFPNESEAWVPATVNDQRDNAFLVVIARLRRGATQAEAQSVLQTVADRIDSRIGNSGVPTRVAVLSLHERLVGGVRQSLLTFLAAVAFVLLIACANVANLLLARAAARPKELAIRAALGAGRSRIVRQLLTESIVLSVIGGTCGLLVAAWLVRGFVRFGPSDIPRLASVALDGWALGFTLVLSLVTGLLFGVLPVVRASKPDLIASLQEGGGRTTGNIGRSRLGKLLVAGEVFLALVLLIGAGLLMRSFIELRKTSLGFEPRGSLTASVTLPPAAYPTSAHAAAFYRESLERLRALPSMQAAGIISAPPLGRTGARISGDITVEGEAGERHGVMPRKLAASGDYFRAAGIPLHRGRLFDDRDTSEAPAVLIISESLARQLWPGGDPIGKRLSLGWRGEGFRTVIGVVGDVKHDDVRERMRAAVYQAYSQVADGRRWMVGEMTFIVRTTLPPEESARSVRAALAEVDPAVPLYGVAGVPAVLSARVANPRFYTLLLGSFSLLALVLAAAGIYGVVAYSVSQRTREISIRMALGATRSSVRRLVLGEGMTPVVAGSLLGLLGAYALTGTLSSFVYQIRVTDPLTFVLIWLLLACVALVACAVPAWRATRIDPVSALRRE